jgi:GNAT superfamily N-acetyltransferase
MNSVTIREARRDDAPALAELRYALRSSTGVATEPKTEFSTRCCEWIKQHLIPGSLWHCWVAEVNEDLLGCIWLQLVEKIPNPRAECEHHAYITSFFVRESARGQGVGKRLLTTALGWCRGRDIDQIILWPTERSRSLYERHGFKAPANVLQRMNADED